MKIRMHKGYFFVLIITLLFVGASIIYHAHLTKPVENNVSKEFNDTPTDNYQELADLNSKFMELNNKIIELNNSDVATLPPIIPIIIGGGYEQRLIPGWSHHCKTWGEANCLDDEVICPENYTKFGAGKYEKDQSEKIKWFICVR